MLSGKLPLTEDSFAANKLDLETQKKALQFALWELEKTADWQRDHLFDTVKTLAKNMSIKLGDFNAPLFVAVIGTRDAFSVMDAMELLGSDMTRARLRDAINALGGVGKKVLKRFEKEYAILGQEVQPTES